MTDFYISASELIYQNRSFIVFENVLAFSAGVSSFNT